ncbi:DUF4383 domain-containing protein [Pseudarthrobacter sp. NBSH8]|uniref:DUF4383 domain-containing protein n=1 Tax=Pseudarthrobacter sp. NBSH8 TaxID=2596911 RepID=UPI00162A7603|nr:DUF4383 domain-containing protein [Pseudarthrobacter sp. NBSH8]
MARWFQLGGGIVYLVLWIYGLVIDMDGADNWLHLVLGRGMVGLGLWLAGMPWRRRRDAPHSAMVRGNRRRRPPPGTNPRDGRRQFLCVGGC